MTKSQTKKPLAVAIGSAFAVSLAASPIVNAEQNPFSMNELFSGYQVADMEGNCGGNKNKEANCGGKKGKESNCGSKMNKAEEGEGNCGAQKKARKEGQCGEAKCGGNMKNADKSKEGNCGGSNKSKEGKCGS